MMARLLMMRSVIILPLCLLLAAAASGRTRAARPTIVEPGHILFVAAHPDDEVVLAPLLGSLCVEGGSTCAFLVLTRGEAGVCELPLCSPDLATVREQEMLSSAAIFGARVTQWSLPDVLTGFESAWPEAGERIATAILDERPDVVITFDPLHGTTCHPAHRALGALVVDLVRSLDPAPPLYLLATAARLEEGRYRFQAGTVPAMAFDGTKWWQYSIEAASAHASQFTPAQLDALRATAASERMVWLTRPSIPRSSLVSCP